MNYKKIVVDLLCVRMMWVLVVYRYGLGFEVGDNLVGCMWFNLLVCWFVFYFYYIIWEL